MFQIKITEPIKLHFPVILLSLAEEFSLHRSSSGRTTAVNHGDYMCRSK